MTRSPVVRALAVAPVAALPFVTVRRYDPHVPGSYPACPVRALLGVDCPGCGSLRGLYELAHGHVLAALDHNALLLVVLPLVALEVTRWVAHRPPSAWIARRHAPAVVLTVLAAWVLVRNLPLSPFDVLASTAA